MERRVFLGVRQNGEAGIFIAPAGLDAYTAADSQLILSITGKISALIAMGYISGGGGQTVPLGWGARPHVMITGRPNFAGVPGFAEINGPTRPSPIGIYSSPTGPCYADIAGDYSSMYVTAPSAVSYAIFNEALT